MSSEISGLAFPCFAPPAFPEEGRLKLSKTQVNANYKKQIREAEEYRARISKQAGVRLGFTCSQSLHISLFFDGTGNNEYNDTKASHPTNIAKLFHASIEGHDSGYFRYYMPGVGTPFPKIGEMDYSNDGLAFATGGEDRINWGLLRLVDALSYVINPTHKRLDDDVAKGLILDMRAHWPITGEVNRRSTINPYLEKLQEQLNQARPLLLKVKLFIYGFSRGAAEARTFVNWLTQLPDPKAQSKGQPLMLAGLPVSIEFLGLLDTVASVGAAHILPGAAGHMGWADSTQQLPDESQFPGLIKCCRHFVAAHEQRLCFPLDSIRRPDGSYPSDAQEVIYPGMHSDVGGGYPVRDQGKSCESAGEILSQIVLHDMYLAAFDAGSPLSVQFSSVTPLIKEISPARVMDKQVILEFDINSKILKRFNIWRQTLLNTTLQGSEEMGDTGEGYHPYQLSQALESAVIEQIGWITAWRIGRYANGSLTAQYFYKNAPQLDEAGLEKEAEAHDEKMKIIKTNREKILKDRNTLDESHQGIPDLDPTNAQYQLREAAREFQSDYKEWGRDINGSYLEKTKQVVLDVIPKYAVFLINGDDEYAEYQEIKSDGDRLYSQLFIDELGTGTHTQPHAELLALYDEQVHDSRAWFMQSALGGREPWGGYFRYRMIYCGNKANKKLQLISVDGKVVGAQPTSNRVVYLVEPKTAYKGEVHMVQDLVTGRSQTLGANTW
ncbi:MAG: T6SS phospholipase effector Tle1-like catalytic domain-containing protein [Kluyvera sp.]